MKIKITSINQKLIASLTAATLMLGTAGAAYYVETNKSRFVYKKNIQGEYVAINAIESQYLNNYYVVITKTEDKDYIGIGRKETDLITSSQVYYDAFSNDKIIYQEKNNEFANTRCMTIPLTEFILYYDGVIKEEYTSEDLEDIYTKIINYFKVDTNTKRLVLNN